jgi:hypothetical protein
MYDVDAPPITSRFSRSQIDEVWTSVPARGTNKLLMGQSNTRMPSLPACTNVDDPMRQMIENPMVINMMRAFANMANAGQPPGRGPPPAPFNIEYREQSLFRNEHAALSNGEGLQHAKAPTQEPQDTAHVGAAAGPLTRQSTSSTFDKDIEEMIGQGLNAPPKAKVQTGKKPADGADTDDEKDDADRAEKRGGDKKNKKRDGRIMAQI